MIRLSQHAGKHVVFVTWKTGNAPAFAAAKRLGHHVTLIRSLEMESLQRLDFETSPYGASVDEVHCLQDASDLDALRACVGRIHKARPIAGFIASTDAFVIPVAQVAAELGIPFTDAAAARTAKQKSRCRQALAAAGVEDTAHAVVKDLGDALGFAAVAGYPLVLKPETASASEGAFVLADEAGLRAAMSGVAEHAGLYRHGVLLEEYLRGTFLSAEIGLSRGRVLRLAVSERKTWEGHEPLEIGTTIPAAISDAQYEVVMDFAERVIKAVDLRLGIFHVEIMLGADGVPRLIELNPRVMGSCLPNLFCLATGIDFFELLVRVYLDEALEPGPIAFTHYATVRWFGAADREPTPSQLPDLDWAEEYRPALRSLSLAFPDAPMLEPHRGNLGAFGEVQVRHADYNASIDIATHVVDRVASQLGMEVTR